MCAPMLPLVLAMVAATAAGGRPQTQQACGPVTPRCLRGAALYGFGFDDKESKSAAACCAAAAAWRTAGAGAWELEARVPAKHAPECKIYASYAAANETSQLRCT